MSALKCLDHGRPPDIITKKRLRRMCNYFKNKPVHVEYHYADSMGNSWVRELDFTYDEFCIEAIGVSGFEEFTVVFKSHGNVMFTQEFPGHQSAYFTGLGCMSWLNSGPYCHFKIAATKTQVAILVHKLLKLFS